MKERLLHIEISTKTAGKRKNELYENIEHENENSGVNRRLMLTLTSAFGHSDNESGPNGGRILEFSKNQSLHGEVTLTNGMFHVAVLDKNMKRSEIIFTL